MCTSSFLEKNSDDIKLIKKNSPAGTRSLSIEPTASLGNNTIYVYLDIPSIETMRVVVKDFSGNTVYSSTAQIANNLPYSFTLNNTENGVYILELSYGANLFYGYFYM